MVLVQEAVYKRLLGQIEDKSNETPPTTPHPLFTNINNNTNFANSDNEGKISTPNKISESGIGDLQSKVASLVEPAERDRMRLQGLQNQVSEMAQNIKKSMEPSRDDGSRCTQSYGLVDNGTQTSGTATRSVATQSQQIDPHLSTVTDKKTKKTSRPRLNPFPKKCLKPKKSNIAPLPDPDVIMTELPALSAPQISALPAPPPLLALSPPTSQLQLDAPPTRLALPPPPPPPLAITFKQPSIKESTTKYRSVNFHPSVARSVKREGVGRNVKRESVGRSPSLTKEGVKFKVGKRKSAERSSKFNDSKPKRTPKFTKVYPGKRKTDETASRFPQLKPKRFKDRRARVSVLKPDQVNSYRIWDEDNSK